MQKQFKLISRNLAIAVFSLGVVVMTGWLLDISILKSMMAGIVSMKVNTAICFILCGCLWLLNDEKQQNAFKRIGSVVFPIIIVLTGLLTLGEFLFRINFGIDEFLFKDDLSAIATSSPGRMAPITAFCFVLFCQEYLYYLFTRAKHFNYFNYSL
jgi:methyl-accepting chemotaxis protein